MILLHIYSAYWAESIEGLYILKLCYSKYLHLLPIYTTEDQLEKYIFCSFVSEHLYIH